MGRQRDKLVWADRETGTMLLNVWPQYKCMDTNLVVRNAETKFVIRTCKCSACLITLALVRTWSDQSVSFAVSQHPFESISAVLRLETVSPFIEGM